MSICTQQMRNKQVGMQKGAVWNTEVEPSTADELNVESFTLPTGNLVRSDNENDSGRGMATAAYKHNYEPQAASLVMKLFERGNFEKLIYSFMGAQAITGSSIYTKTYILQKCVSGIFNTFAWDEGSNSKCLNSAVTNEFSISTEDGFKLNASFMGDQLSDQTGVFTNPLGVTAESAGDNIFKVTGANFYINDQTAGALAAGDILKATNYNPVFTRGYVARAAEGGQTYTSEPRDVNAPVIMMNLITSEIVTASGALLADYVANTYQKAKLEIVGSLISGSDYYTITFYFPKLEIFSSPDYGFDGSTPVTLAFKAMEAAANPTGFDNAVPYIVVKNLLNTDYTA